MGKVEIYGVIQSPPTRAVLMVAEAIKIPYQLKDIMKVDREEFKRLNPQLTIPFLVDDGFILTESRAIMKYLLDNYAKDDSLYPKDLKTRAIINARLDFDCGNWWPKFYVPIKNFSFFNMKITEETLKTMHEPVQIVEEFLTREKWVAGPKMTIADISFYAIASTYSVSKLDLSQYPKIIKWMEECKKNISSIKLNEEGLEVWRKMFEENYKKNPFYSNE